MFSASRLPAPRAAARLHCLRDALIERWARRVLDDALIPQARRLPRSTLTHHIAALTDHLIEALSASSPPCPDDPESGTYARAVEHARFRFSVGYTAAEALRELSHYRAALLAVSSDREDPLDVDEIERIHAILDATLWAGATEMERVSRASLEGSEARLRLATQAGGVGIWDHDLTTGRVCGDERCRELFGVDPGAELSFASIVAALHPEDRPRLIGAMERLGRPRDGDDFCIEYRARGPRAGDERWIEARGRAMRDERGRAIRLIGTLTDVSERKRKEAERNEEIAFRDRFIGILGHDLRTPLTAIKLAASMLLQRGALKGSEARGVQRIAASAERMARMIDDLLDLTRARLGGGIPVSPRTADLHRVCAGVIEELRGVRPEIPIVLERHGSGVGTWDTDRVAQMVANLVRNAVDYSAPDAPVRVAVSEEGPDVRIEVHNVGPVIQPEVMATIFDPFRQGSQLGRASSGQGLGLGLFIARQIAQAHRGDISVRSAPEEGTTFTVRLPRGG